MSAATEFLLGFYMGYMMIANYPRFKQGCREFFNHKP